MRLAIKEVELRKQIQIVALCCICSDLRLSSLLCFLHFIIYSVLPQTTLVSPACSLCYTPHAQCEPAHRVGYMRTILHPRKRQLHWGSAPQTALIHSQPEWDSNFPEWNIVFPRGHSDRECFFSRVCTSCAPISQSQTALATFWQAFYVCARACTEAEPILSIFLIFSIIQDKTWSIWHSIPPDGFTNYLLKEKQLETIKLRFNNIVHFYCRNKGFNFVDIKFINIDPEGGEAR